MWERSPDLDFLISTSGDASHIYNSAFRIHNFNNMPLGFETIVFKDHKLKILDQSLLPSRVLYHDLATPEQVADAIRTLKVRGAPLIGVTAAYGIALAAINSTSKDYKSLKKELKPIFNLLKNTRPTAYNLFYALKRMEKVLDNCRDRPSGLSKNLLEEAEKMREEDIELCNRIGENGVKILSVISRGLINQTLTLHILTHCNAGALATCGIGTALAPIYKAKETGIDVSVFVPETRPWLQGARLTTWELQKAGIPCTLIVDSARGYILQNKMVDLCLVGADRIAKNGDVANKIGTYALAVLAKENSIPFYVVAPSTTFDTQIESGSEIIIEQRAEDEVREFQGMKSAPPDIPVFNPVFDITPARYITGYITEDLKIERSKNRKIK